MDPSESSYMLVYIKRHIYNQYQSIQTSFSHDYIKEKIRKEIKNSKKTHHEINVVMIDNFESL